MDGEDLEFHWAHVLWQNKRLRLEEFAAMPRHIQLAYIASESLEAEKPRNILNQWLASKFKKRGGDGR